MKQLKNIVKKYVTLTASPQGRPPKIENVGAKNNFKQLLINNVKFLENQTLLPCEQFC